MSDTLYPINYDDTGFFSSDPNVIATFPFSLESVVEWAQKPTLTHPLSGSDAAAVAGLADEIGLFDSRLSTVITNPKNKSDFVDTFLLEQQYYNEKFDSILVSTAKVAASNRYKKSSVKINGTLYKGTRVKSTNGSTSYLLGRPSSQRVIYQPICTENHLHFPKCSVQEIINDTNESYYKCYCEGTAVFNNDSHSHCKEDNSHETDPVKVVQAAYKGWGGTNSSTGGSDTTTVTDTSKDGSNTKFNVDYANKDELEQTDKLLRLAIYDYYCAVNKNMKYKSELKSNRDKSRTATQALTDSTVKYKTQYLTAFNLLSGILIAGGYIYTMNK